MATTTRTVTDQSGQPVQREVAEVPQDSVEISINAKGDPQWCIKAYGADATEISERIAALRHVAEEHAASIRNAKPA